MWSHQGQPPPQQGGQPPNPPPPGGAPPPAHYAGAWAPPPQQPVNQGYESEEDDGALGATINLVTSAASMFFKGSARPPPPQAAPQQHPEKIKAPPAPIEPPSSMLDMDPSPPAPAYEAKPEFVPPSQIANGPAAGYFSSFPATTPQLTTIDSQGSTSRLRPPSQPPTPTADRAFAHSPVLGNSPRMMAPSSPLASSSPRVSISSISPGTATGVAVPTIPTLTLTAPQLPLMKPPTPVVSQPLTPVAGVFSGGSAPSTPAASGMVANSIAPSQGLPAQSLAAATPPTQYVTRKTGGNEAANIFGAPPTPAATDAAAIFSTGSAPSTPAASGLMANSIPASQGMPAPILATSTPSAHQPFMKTGNEAANIFGSTPPAVQDPQIPVANHAANLFGGATAVSDAANQPVQANHPTASMIQTPQAQPTTSAPLETIEKTTLPPMQRSTPPSSPRRYEPPASPATPLMRNQNLTNKAQTPELSRPSPKSTVSSNLPTPIRRNLRPPPKAQTSPRTTPSRAKFRLPPPRKKATPLKFGAGKEDKAKITTPRDEIPSAPTSPRRDLPSTPKSEQLTPGIIDPQLSEDKSGPPSLPTMAHAEQQAPVETKTEPSMAETPRTTVPEETTAHEFAPEETPKVVEASGLGMDEPSLDSLPDGWMEIVDPASGRFYYLNETTKETSWEKPQCEQANQETPALAPETETEGEDSAKPNEEQNDTRIPEEGTIDETDKATPPTSENEEEVKAESPEILPEGWVVAIDPSSGQSYYYNSISQETRWERPIVEESESAGEQWEWPKDDEPSPEAEISHKEAIDSTFAEMNAEFGIDEMRETGETSKEENQSAEIEDETATMEALRLAPGESDDPTRSETEPTKFPSNLPDGWSEIVDPSSGRTYYYNSITQDTSWEYPFRQREESITHTELENQSEDAMVDTTIQEIASNLTPETAEPELFHQSEAAQSLPKGWTEVLDPQSGSTYYYNAVTQETSWERPAETEKTETGERIGAQAASAKSEKMASGNMPETEKHFPETPECTGKPKEFHEATSFEAQPENVAAGAEQFVEDEPRAPEFCESTLVDDLPDSDQPETEIVEEEAAEARDANVYDRLQDDWVEVVDPASGQTYYCNTITQETSWERPLQEGQLSAEQPEGDTTTAEQTNVEEKLSSIDAHGDSFKDDAPDGDQPETEVAESEAVDRPSFDDQSLPDGWVEAEDPASGQIYYYNTVTQETSWEKPVKVASPAKAQAFDSASGQLDERDQVQSLQTEDDIAADVPEADKSKPETAAEEQAESDIIDQGLPDGWIEAEDPASGKIYYYNTVTQETSWEKPMQVASPAKDQAEGFDSAPEQLDEEDEPRSLEAEDDIVADVSETDDKGLPDDWVEADDGASGQIYYYNTVTQETAWEKPILVGQPEDEQPESGALPEQPDEEDEPRSLETEDTVAEDVPEADESEPEAVGEEPVESDIVNKGLPDGWVEVEDPASGQIYYYNTVTQETSWEMPILEGQPEDQQQESEGASTEQPDEEDEPQSLETEDDIVADVPETEEPEPETAGEEPSDGEFIDQGLPDDWVEAEDPASGKIYYYNTVTQETSWEKPTPEQPGERDQPQSLESEDDIPADVPEADEPEPEAVGEEPVESDIVNKGLPDGWVEVEDPASGQIYYYNKVTQETSWEKPVVEGQPEEEQQVSEGAPTKQPDEEDDPQSLETEDDIPADVPETDEPKPEKAGEEPPGGEIIDQGMPDDWVKAEDPACGKTSNYNTVPEETTWQKHMKVVLPAKDQAENDDAARQQPGGAEAPSLEVVSDAPPESTHLEPRESEKIEDVDTGDSNVGEEGLPDDWVETKDPAGGQIYYYNTATQETSWERPSHPVQAEDYDSAIESKEALPSQQEELEQDEIDQPSALGEWSEEIDPQSGQVYYYNRSTMETRWDSPKTLEKEEPSAEVNVEESGREEEEADEDKSSEVEGDSSDMPVDWTEAVDPASGNIFYYNTVTGETSWENPFGQAANPKNESTEGKDDTDAIDVSREGSLDQFEDEFEVTEDDTKSSDGEGAKDEFEDEVKGKETNLPKATKLSDLPEFWTDAVDPSTGKIYYFNSLTQETSWDRPTIESKTDQSESIDDVSVDQKDPGQVEPVKSEETPEEDSKESEESNIAEGGSLEKTDSYVLPANWTEVEAPQNGQKYYYNEVTQETLLDRPSQDETVVTHSPRGEERILIEDQRDNQTPEIVAPTNEDLNPDAKGTPDKGPDEIYVSPEADALPEGWVELVDPGSGATYYFNEIDSSTTWERPTASSAIESTNTPEKEGGGVVEPEEDRPQSEFSEKEEVPVPETADCSGKTGDLGKHGQRPVAEDSGHTLPDGWIELVDPSSGTPYYFNETTEETSWDRPAARKGEMSIPATSETEGAGFTGMQEIVTPEEKYLEQVNVEKESDKVEGEAVESPEGDQNELPLQNGWVELVDPSSGQPYYFNEAENQTLWERPVVQVVSKSSLVPALQGKVLEAEDATAAFEFVGMLSSFLPKEGESEQLVITRTAMIATKKRIAKIEDDRRCINISGPLNLGEESAVLAYIESKVINTPDDLLWKLIEIAAKSKGRLRSDEGVSEKSSPESAIVKILLQDDPPRANANPKRDSGLVQQTEDEAGKQSSMEKIQNLLVCGKRIEAVDEAISCHEFATALLVASMCDAETYKRAAKEYAERAFAASSPMHTVAFLFSGCLQVPPASTSKTDLWGVDPLELKLTWKQHLASIISNRTVGWDRIVLSLGDRLDEIGDCRSAHFCYMICGCPISNPISQDTRIALLGCNHNEKINLALMTDEALIAYERTEAYEWAKRRGNVNAAIQSFQPFKAVYAMLLADFGLKDNARRVTQSIRQCTDIPLAKNKKPTTTSMSQLFRDRETLAYALKELEFRVESRRKPEKQTSKDRKKGEDNTASRQRSKESAIAMTDAERKGTTSVDMRPPGPNQDSLVGSTSQTGKTNGISTHPAFGMQVPTKIMKNEHEPRSRLHNQSLETENDATLTDESFTTAKSNLMEKSAYNNDKPEMPPLPNAGVSEKLENSQQASSGQEGPPMFKTMVPGTPQQHPTKQPPPVLATPQETKRPKSPPRTAPAVMTGKKPGEKSHAPLSSEKSGGSWSLGLQNWIVKKLNPDAHQVTLVESEEKAYYDEKRKVWVFPGDDPEELVKPVGPPPKTPVASKTESAPEPETSKDPLSQLMAPPPRRGLSSTKRPGAPGSLSTPGGYPGMPSPGMPSPAAGIAPPQFAVFQPKSATKEDK